MTNENLSWCWQYPSEPSSLILKSVQLPELKNDQVLIANRVIGLNPVDWKFIQQPGSLWQMGHIPGVDGMGTVIAVGDSVTHIKIGTRVCYHTNLLTHGSFSQHTLVSAKAIIPVPDGVSDEAAASIPCPGLTAWQAMRKLPEIKGKRILVNGAGGSVGSFLTQLLIQHGAQVYATASPANHKRLNRWGVIHSFDYSAPNWQQTLRDILGEQSLYAAFDMVSGEHAATLAPLLGYYGHLVCVQDRLTQPPISPFTTCLSLHEIALGAIHQHGDDKQWAELVQAGQNLLTSVMTGELSLPELNIDRFENLPYSLLKLKQNNRAIKYLITL